jgi:DNA-binding NarL/FixJ family response regulator
LKNFRVHFPELKVLMLSMHDETLYALRAIKAGAQGYIMKVSAAEEVVTAVRQVLRGEVYLSPKMSRQTMMSLVGRRKEGAASPLDDLSDRELEVFQMVGDGMTTKQIAEKLHLSVKTIETHKMHIKEKLHLETATQLTQHAVHARI